MEKGNINVAVYADSNCSECFGRGYIARNVITNKLIVCNKCVRRNYIKHLAEERSKEYAVLQGQSL